MAVQLNEQIHWDECAEFKGRRICLAEDQKDSMRRRTPSAHSETLTKLKPLLSSCERLKLPSGSFRGSGHGREQ